MGHMTRGINNVYVCTCVQSRLSGVELAATVFVNVHLKRIMEKLDELLASFNDFKSAQLQATSSQVRQPSKGSSGRTGGNGQAGGQKTETRPRISISS